MRVNLVRKMFKEVNDFTKDSEYLRLFDEEYQKDVERKLFKNIKESKMDQLNKLIAYAKAHKTVSIFVAIVVVGVIANALGLG